MADAGKPRIIAIEEHFQDAALVEAVPGTRGGVNSGHNEMSRLMRDFADSRLQKMDAAGVDMQVIGHGSPSGQVLPADTALELARGVNDRFAKIIREYPKRYAGYAMLPTALPDKAADELQRAVEELGLVGAMTNGLQFGTEFLDDKKYWPI